MKKIKLIYKKCDDPYTTGNEWDYLCDTNYGTQLWSCSYALDRDATVEINNIDTLDINEIITVYTDDITDDELDALDDACYDRLSWDDYEYYCYCGDIVDGIQYGEIIQCVMDGDNMIVDVIVTELGEIMGA